MVVHITFTALAVFIILFLVFLVGLLIYLYPSTSKSSLIPGPNPSDAREGNISDLRHAGSLQQYLDELHEEYGDVISFWHGTTSIISVADVENFAPRNQIFDIPSILFEGWRPLIGDHSFLYSKGVNMFQRRDTLEYKIDKKAKELYGKIFLKLSKELEEKWTSMPDGQHIPLTQHIRGLATKLLCRMLLGEHFKDDAKVIQLHKAWEHCWTYVESLAADEDPVSLEKDFHKSREVLVQVLEEAMDARFRNQTDGGPKVLLDGLLSSSKSSALNEKQLLSDALTQLTIGMLVTNSVLLWVMYFLASHTDVQENLRKELKKAEDPEIMPETVLKIKYMQMVLKESVRCGYVFSWAGRQQDIDININGNLISKNTPVIEAIGTAMTDERNFSDPSRFDPKRFSESDEKVINPLHYIPFAIGGSRKAPQDSLVFLLASIVASTLIRNLKVTIAGDSSQNQPHPDFSGFVSRPSKEELWVTVSTLEKKAETVGAQKD